MKKLMILLVVNIGIVFADANFHANPLDKNPCTDNVYIATDDGDGVFLTSITIMMDIVLADIVIVTTLRLLRLLYIKI